MFFDIHTLLFINLIVNILSAGTMALIWYQYRRRFAGLSIILVDLILNAIGIGLILLRGTIPDVITIVLGNGLMLTGLVLLLIGLEWFVDKRGPQIHNYLLLFFYFSSVTYFVLIQPNLWYREMLLAGMTILFDLQICLLLFWRTPRALRPATNIAGLVMGCHTLFSLIILILEIAFPFDTNDFFRSGFVGETIVITYLLLNIWIIIALVMMVTRRLLGEIQAQEEKYTKAFHSSPYAVFLTRKSDGIIIEVNDGFTGITGYQPEEVIGKTALEISLWSNLEDKGAFLLKLMEGKVKGIEIQFRHKAGNLMTGLYSADVITIHDEVCILANIDDITERKQAEEGLRESEEQFRNLFEHAPVGIFHSIPGGKFLAANPALVSMLGYSSPEELISNTTDMTTQIYVNPEERPKIMQALLSTDGWVHYDEVLWRRKDQGIISVDMTGRKVQKSSREISYLEGFIVDITERKQIEQALKENEEKFISIFEEAPDPILILDAAYHILEVNRGFENVFDCFNNLVTESYIDDLGMCLTGHTLDLILEKTGSGDNITHQEMNLVRQNGVPFIADVAISRIIIQSKPCLLIQIHDIDEIRRAHDAITQVNNKLKILSSITRHDILNRIIVTSAYSEMILEEITDETLRKRLDAIKQVTHEIQNLIEFTGQYNDLGATIPEWQKIEYILNYRLIQGLLSGIELTSDLAGLEIYADRMLEKVMYNLIENSVRHGQNLTRICLTSHEKARDMVILYEDDGGGLIVDEKEKAFKKGFGKNTGLGLFLIREILSITGISIIENGEPGVGVRFEIRVPAGKWRRVE
jgi:PAS domain S-box-containing protein